MDLSLIDLFHTKENREIDNKGMNIDINNKYSFNYKMYNILFNKCHPSLNILVLYLHIGYYIFFAEGIRRTVYEIGE